MAGRAAATTATPDERLGVQSVETGLAVLAAFIGTDTTPMLKTIAERAQMPPAKAHRYLVSLCRTGFAVQDPVTGRYRLGEAALRLGFAAMAAIDVLAITRPLLGAMCQEFHQSLLVAVWGAGGPTVALQEFIPAAVTISATVGGTLPMLRSSTGRTFGAWLPRSATAPLLRQELDWLQQYPASDCPSSLEGCDALFADVRLRGLARSAGQLNAALNALSAPIFDSRGHIVAVLTVLGSAGQLDVNFSGALALALQRRAKAISGALGYSQPAAA
ncbi:MAG: IclR family transcriptional regulator [Pseudomonadota bacterium]